MRFTLRLVLGVIGSLACLSLASCQCEYDGKTFQPYVTVYNVYDKRNNWCSIGICKPSGSIWKLIDLSCRRTIAPTELTTTRRTATTTKTTKQTTTIPEGAVGTCNYKGKEYSAGSEVFRGIEKSKGTCYVLICSTKGEVIVSRKTQCKPNPRPDPGPTTKAVEEQTAAPETFPPTTLPVETTAPTTVPFTRPPGCYSDGKYYQPGAEISKGYDERSNWCYGSYCEKSGEIIHWDTWNCKSTTGPPEPATTAPETFPPTTLPVETTVPTTVPFTRPPGCYSDGKYYHWGAEISKGYDETSNWCYGSYCDESGEIIQWDTWNCKSTTGPPERKTTAPESFPPTTLPVETTVPTTEAIEERTTPPTTIPFTRPPGCYSDGKYYQPGAKISKGYDASSNWCYGSYCDERGEIVQWDKWNCKTTTTTPTTVPFTRPPGCYSDGKYYQPGAKISKGYDASSNWCYGSYCDKNGDIVQWDKWNCKTTTTTPTTVPFTHPPGCYSDGKYYHPGAKISKGYDASSNWCYGSYCGEYGEIVQWDKWNCKSTTGPPEPETTAPETVPQRSSVSVKTTAAITTLLPVIKDCFYDSRTYKRGSVVYEKFDPLRSWCYGLVCNENGGLVYWDNWNCVKPQTTPRPLLGSLKEVSSLKKEGEGEGIDRQNKANGCFYDGAMYERRQFIRNICENNGRDLKCSLLFCNQDGVVVPKRIHDITRDKSPGEPGSIFIKN